MRKTSTQASKLLPSLFQHLDEEQSVTVFHVGPAVSETVDFFANYRCKLHFIDLFAELPIKADEDNQQSLLQQFATMMQFPNNTQFDICLFWDVFNFLDRQAVGAFMTALQPNLKKDCTAHAFSVHNRKAPQVDHLYGIGALDMLTCRSRRTAPPGYAPHSQSELTQLLNCFRLERSVLLPDSRLELLLHASL
ncbi:MAG: hypothetical protein R3E64_04740 [Halioglobus sp.]